MHYTRGLQTRKSLQGLDYFAADGACAFDELEGFVLQLGDLGLGKEWQVRYVKSLKVAKFYLRGDFKVSNQKCFKKIGLRFSSRVISFHK